MSQNRQAELTAALLRYAALCVADGDEDALRELRIDAAQIREIGALTLAELANLETVHMHCFEVRFDPQRFRVLKSRLTSAWRYQELRLALIEADAPRLMMQALFGMQERDYSRTRRLLGVTTGAGRPRSLDEATEHGLWRALSDSLSDNPRRPLEPDQYLRAHRQHGISMRTLWSYTQRWARERQAAAEVGKAPR
ncbi:MAG: DUF2857 family protein [Gammaproteobacteria bacterium]|nr:DUF2857 family protein [Gammaproteobacteria bacterium]MYE51633.1 DUF2857 family protein [Gammaproteobacteria bacterium]MYK82553.1 DUF2857 family protein [Gammaproteobacteria bacterium]